MARSARWKRWQRSPTRLLWSQQSKLIATLPEQDAAIYAVATSGDGKLTASARNDNTVNVWDRNGALMATFVGHSARVTALAFSPDGQTLASGSQDNTLKLWQRDGRLLHTAR